MLLGTPSARQAAERLAPNLYTAIERWHNVLAHVEAVLGDEKSQSNIRKTLDNLAAASEHIRTGAGNMEQLTGDARNTLGRLDEAVGTFNTTATKAGQRVDELGDKLAEVTDKLSRLLDHGIAIGHNMREGQGTAAMLLNDPKLYEELMLTLQRFGALADEFMILVEQWQRKGLLSSVK